MHRLSTLYALVSRGNSAINGHRRETELLGPTVRSRVVVEEEPPEPIDERGSVFVGSLWWQVGQHVGQLRNGADDKVTANVSREFMAK